MLNRFKQKAFTGLSVGKLLITLGGKPDIIVRTCLTSFPKFCFSGIFFLFIELMYYIKTLYNKPKTLC